MAKAEKSKSQLIREYLEKHPDSKTKEIHEAFKSQGVSYQLVAKVASDWRKEQGLTKKKRRRPGRPRKTAGTAAKATTTSKSSQAVDLGSLDEGVRFVEQCGGVNQAKQVLEVISRISSIESGKKK
ncbi:MAG: hypothetical protein D6753_17080 [Planctomycetota bacterium]|nr:MAG: hypothetical protein D6753_17080 [Planctomycetota bacterium]